MTKIVINYKNDTKMVKNGKNDQNGKNEKYKMVKNGKNDQNCQKWQK